MSLRKKIAIRTRPVLVLAESDNLMIAEVLTEFNVDLESSLDKLQYASLLLRIQHSYNNRPEEVRLLLNKIHAQLSQAGKEAIPFLNVDISPEASFKESYDEQVRRSLANKNRVLHTQHTRPWACKARGTFLESQAGGSNRVFAKDETMLNQDVRDLGEKYDHIQLCFDPSEMMYIRKNFTDLDHLSPWTIMCKRVSQSINSLNKLSEESRIKVYERLNVNYLKFFLLEAGTNKLQASEYLRECLYNYTGNLVSISRTENGIKNNKTAIKWLSQHPLYGQKFIEYFMINPDDKEEMESLVDMSGFTPAISFSPKVSMFSRGMPLGNALTSYARENYHSPHLATIEEEVVKTDALLKTTQALSLSEADKENLQTELQGIARGLQIANIDARDQIRKVYGDVNELGPIGRPSPTKSRRRTPSDHSSDSDDSKLPFAAKMKMRVERRKRILAESIADLYRQRTEEEAEARAKAESTIQDLSTRFEEVSVALDAEAQARAAANIRSIKMALKMYDRLDDLEDLNELGLTPEKAREIIAQHESGTSKK